MMLKLAILLISLSALINAQLDMNNDRMGFEDNIAEESQSDEQIFANTITSKPILNDGKPFYVARDPTTGTLDFNMKKTVGIQNDIPVSRKDELSGNSKSGHDINSLGQNNFHDYLNLPVKYTSSKFVYPLISGSYANLKYQGNNKNQVSNHKNYTTTLGTTTMSPKYFTHITNPDKNAFTLATFKQPETTETFKVTTHRPTTTMPLTTQKFVERTETSHVTTTSPPTTQPSTVKYSSTIIQQNSFPSTFKNKYVDSSETRKKTTMATTSTKVLFSTKPPANPIKFIDLDELLETVEKTETKATTYRPQYDETRLSFSTSMPLQKPSAFRPMPSEDQKNTPNSQKISFEKGPSNPSIMSLSEIINSFSGNDDLSNEQNSIHYEPSDSSKVEIRKPLPATAAPATSTPAPVNLHKTLQQQIQDTKPQFVNLPVHQQSNFGPPNSHVGFPSDSFDDYVEFENPEDAKYASEFVKYEVQKPNVNLVKFNQMPSMNNVVISPGQNSASFVLGSQQSVGSVGVGSSLGVGTNNFADNNGPMKVGQVINDDAPIRGSSNQVPVSNQIQASIRFPSEAESSFDNAPIVKGTIKLDSSSENVQPPQALSQNLPPTQKPLVFPTNQHLGPNMMSADVSFGKPAPTSNPTNPSQVIFENVNDIYEKVNEKKQKQEFTSNEISNNIPSSNLTPPQILTPPSQNQQRPFNNNNNNRQQSQPPYFNMRRPGPQRPNIPGLPNILPQFRPNAKSSQGHPQIHRDAGAIRVPFQGQGPNSFTRQYPAPKLGLPPMMSQPSQNMNQQNFRRLPPTRQYVTRVSGPSHPPQQNFDSGNRRIFRVPPQQQQLQQQQQQFQQQQPMMNNDRMFMKPPPPPPMSPPGFQLRRPQNGAPETMQMQQRPSNIPQASQAPDSELNKSSPPPAIPQMSQKPFDNEVNSNSTRLEPVITLQMLQNKKSGGKLNLPPVPHDIPQDLQELIPSNHKEELSKKPSIYVVYPVSSNSYENAAPLTSSTYNSDPSVVVGSHGESQFPEYQNTPFSVVSHFEQEPLLMKRDKKKNPFPYHLERPAQSNEFKNERLHYGPSHEGSVYNIGEEEPLNARVVNKRPPFVGEHPDAAISSKLTRVTDKPIAIAYTPTEPSHNYPPTPTTNFYHDVHPHHHYSYHYDPLLSDEKFSMPNYGGPVISEILDEKHIGYDYYHRQQQLQQHLNNGEDLDFYKQNYDFQAPFQASVSLNPEVTNPYEGWSIVTQSTDTNKIDRSDLHVVDSSEESTTRKFDPNEFQPVFESGFQPIFSGKQVSTAPEIVLDESSELPSTLALTHSTFVTTPRTTTAAQLSTKSDETSSSAQSKSSEESTTVKIEKKKQKTEIDSLEAFFESLTRDYDDEESANKSENESRSL